MELHETNARTQPKATRPVAGPDAAPPAKAPRSPRLRFETAFEGVRSRWDRFAIPALRHVAPDVAGATPPPNASPFLKAIFQDIQPYLKRGTVDAPHLFFQAKPGSRIARGGPAIRAMIRQFILGSKTHVNMQTFTWVHGADTANAIFEALAAKQEELKKNPGAAPFEFNVLVNHPLVDRADTAAMIVRTAAEYKLDPAFVKVTAENYDHLLFGVDHAKSMTNGEKALLMTNNVEDCDNARFGWVEPKGFLDRLRDRFSHWIRPMGSAGLMGPWNQLCFEFEGRQAAEAFREDLNFRYRQATGRELPTYPVDPTVPEVPEGAVNVMMVTNRARGQLLESLKSPIPQFVFAALDRMGPGDSFEIAQPNINDPALLKSIAEAIHRGAANRIVCSKDFNNFNELTPDQGGTNQKALADLQKRLRKLGVDPAKLQWRWYSHDGKTPVVGNGAYASHEKYWAFHKGDGSGDLVTASTANGDKQSMHRSGEVIAVVDDARTAASWGKQAFEALWKRAIPA